MAWVPGTKYAQASPRARTRIPYTRYALGPIGYRTHVTYTDIIPRQNQHSCKDTN